MRHEGQRELTVLERQLRQRSGHVSPRLLSRVEICQELLHCCESALAQMAWIAKVAPDVLLDVPLNLGEHHVVARLNPLLEYSGRICVGRVARDDAMAQCRSLGVEAGRAVSATQDQASKVRFG